MRTARIKAQGAGYYHVISRVVDRQFILDEAEKDRMRELMRATEAFTGCDVLTYAMLSNHFHVLLHVPEPQEVSDEEFLRRVSCLYTARTTRSVRTRLERLRQNGEHEAAEALKERYTRRMCDLSQFGKTFKQRFTQSYNLRHERKGTLWEERFKSALIEGASGALSAVAAYVDLNAVRAELTQDPADYAFCGYAEAMSGSEVARRGICRLLDGPGAESAWEDVAIRYRRLLGMPEPAKVAEPAVETCAVEQPTMDLPSEPAETPSVDALTPEALETVLAEGGELPLRVALRCRVRYFSDGAILGSRAFVEEAFRHHRTHFGASQSEVHPMTGGAWGELYTARRLRAAPIRLAAAA